MNKDVHDFVEDVLNAVNGENFEIHHTQFKEYRKELESLLEVRGYDIVEGQGDSVDSYISIKLKEMLTQVGIAIENGFGQICVSDQDALFLKGLKEDV